MKKYLPILRTSPLFLGLDDHEILSVLHCIQATLLTKGKGDYIFRSSDVTDAMGLVLSGSALIIQEDFWGHRNILSKCSVGDFFGEPYAAKPGSVLNISVATETDCEILLLNVRQLLCVCSCACGHHQKLIRNLVSVLANKILIFNDKITHISKRTTREKLLSYLSSESIKQGGLSFDIPYSRQELADYLCVERAAMTVELSKLQKEGILTTNRKHFELHREIYENKL
ncbi:MAG: Crp/Fnr family transcriptional regulator [bacterium]|nr:Crp/Fnr family transcriptional regulator [bacterium]